MPILIDTHAHLEMPDFSSDLDAVLVHAVDAGVHQIITVGTDLAASRRAVELAREHSIIFAAVGVHPHDARRLSDQTFSELEALARSDRVVAVGETGLDYYRDLSPRPAQREAFVRQLDLAARLNLPVIIHCRDAYSDLLAVLRERRSSGPRGVCHCFSGDTADAEALMDLGLYLSFTGTITFPNARRARDLVRGLPLDRIMVETDCPYLAPQPHRGRRNEPAFVTSVAQEIAKIHEVSLERVAEDTTNTARELFGLPGPAGAPDRPAQEGAL